MEQAQTDVDRLFYFTTGVVAFLVIVPTVAGVAGLDIRDATLLDDPNRESEQEDIQLLSAFGTEIDDDEVGAVEIVVSAREDAEVDLSQVSVSWTESQEYQLTPPNVGAGDASFAISGDSLLNESRDRAILRFDLGTDDLSDADRFGERLEPGQTVQVSVVTEDGSRVTRELAVPDSLPSRPAVLLF